MADQTFKRSEIAAMTHEEYIANREAIMDATNNGRIMDDGGKSGQPPKPLDEVVKEVEAAGGEVYQPAKKTHFLTSQIAEMTPEQYKANGIKDAWLEGRVHQDNKPEPPRANSKGNVHITEGGAPNVPAWQRKLDREEAVKKAEVDAKAEAEKTIAQKYIEGLNGSEA